jgi:hypothetical protein
LIAIVNGIAIVTGIAIGIGLIETVTAMIGGIVRNATGTVIVTVIAPIVTVIGTAIRLNGTAMAAAMAIDLKTNGNVTVPIATGTCSVASEIVPESEFSSAAARKAAVNPAIGRPAVTAAAVPAGKAMAAARPARAALLRAVRRL